MTDRTVSPPSTHNALADIAKVDGDHQSPGHDRDVDDEALAEAEAAKHDNKGDDVSDDDDDSNDGQEKDNHDDDDEAFADAQAHLGVEWFSRKRDRPDDNSSDSSESLFSHHQKKGKVIQAALNIPGGMTVTSTVESNLNLKSRPFIRSIASQGCDSTFSILISPRNKSFGTISPDVTSCTFFTLKV